MFNEFESVKNVLNMFWICSDSLSINLQIYLSLDLSVIGLLALCRHYSLIINQHYFWEFNLIK